MSNNHKSGLTSNNGTLSEDKPSHEAGLFQKANTYMLGSEGPVSEYASYLIWRGPQSIRQTEDTGAVLGAPGWLTQVSI